MYKYCEIINPDYDPEKNYVYDAFSNYYNNPSLTKIKDVENYSMYICKIYALLGNAYRYLIIFIDKDLEIIGKQKLLKDCQWISLQTRTLEDQHKVSTHKYKIESKHPVNQKINVKSRSENESTYECEIFPLTVTLLHTRKDSMYQYQPEGTLISALETFQTVINFKK